MRVFANTSSQILHSKQIINSKSIKLSKSLICRFYVELFLVCWITHVLEVDISLNKHNKLLTCSFVIQCSSFIYDLEKATSSKHVCVCMGAYMRACVCAGV